MTDPSYVLEDTLAAIQPRRSANACDSLVRIPAGTVVTLQNDSKPNGMVEILWDGLHYLLFRTDLEERASRLGVTPL